MRPPSPGLKRRSLRTQLVAGSVVFLSLVLIAFGVFVRTVVATTLIAAADRELANHAVRPGLGPPPRPRFNDGFPGGDRLPDARPPRPDDGAPDAPGRNDRLPPPLDGGNPPFREGDNNPDRPRPFTLTGQSLDPRDPSRALDPIGLMQSASRNQPVTTTVTADGQSLRILSLPRTQPDGRRIIVQMAYPMDQINAAVRGVDTALLILIPFALLCAGFGGFWITERVLVRVRRMARSAAQIGAQDLSQRLPVIGSDEFSELADTFNGLLGRVETAFQEQQRLVEQQRRFIADASHELKTPLTVIRGTTSLALSGADDGVLDRRSTREIDLAAASMSGLVQDLLYLARADAGRLGRDRVEIPIIELLPRAIASVALRSAAPICLDAADPSLTVPANPSELIRLFTNLLENAARHTPPDGAITITVQGTRESVIISVTDTGIGIAPEHLGHLCERFYRVNSARSRDDGGTGLGLAICKGIVDAHGGILAISSVLGAGTAVTVTLPREGRGGAKTGE